jgi:transposase
VRAGRRTDMSCELEVVIWPPLRLARMRCERGSVIVVLPAGSLNRG